jgi:GntR family transcriptional regulator
MERQALPTPLYHKVFGLLYQRIAQGVYAPGSQIAPEDDLAAEFQVSRATIRQAVGELVKQGVVSRQQGRGTFVNSLPDANPRLVGSLADLVRDTKKTVVKSASLTHNVPLPPPVAVRLNCEPIGTVVERVRTIEGQVFAYTLQYLPCRFGNLVHAKDVEQLGMLTALHRQGVKLDSAHQTVRAELADVTVAQHLDINIASPVLFAERLLQDEEGSPVELVQAWYRGDRYEYQAAIRIVQRGDHAEAVII